MVNATKIGFSAWPGWLPLHLTQSKGIFKENKVAVDLQYFTDYGKSLDLIATGKIDANTQGLAETIRAVANGSDLVVVLTTDNSTGNDKIVVSDKIKSIKDLKGQKVAAEEGSVDHYLLDLALRKAGMTLKDIKLVPLESSKAADAFVKGEVVAAVVYAPHTTIALKRPGSRELLSSSNFPGAVSDHLVFTRKFVKEQPEKVQAIVNSWFATLAYMNRKNNKDEANIILAKRAEVSPVEYKNYADGTSIFTIEDNIESFTAGTETIHVRETAKDMSKFLFDNKLIKANINTDRIFDDRFIKAYFAKR